MDKVIVAFESEKTCLRIKEILEGSNTASCIVCRSTDQVKRMVNKYPISTVICGYKFPDASAEVLFDDLPITCAMLVVANQGMLEMCENREIFKLATPVSKQDLLSTVGMLLQMGRRLERFVRPRRKDEDETIIAEAKAHLMAEQGMSEEEAHRYLQKKSMNTGAKMVYTAQMVLAKA